MGGMRIAMRSSIANAPAMSLGLSCELDVHHTSVTQWEILLRAAMRASLRKFHSDMQATIIDEHGQYYEAEQRGFTVNRGLTFSLTTV